MPDGVAQATAEERISDYVKMTIEQGIIVGIPVGGAIFGVVYNSDSMINGPSQFDFYSGHGLDMTFLGLAQADRHGNANVSKFGSTIVGAVSAFCMEKFIYSTGNYINLDGGFHIKRL